MDIGYVKRADLKRKLPQKNNHYICSMENRATSRKLLTMAVLLIIATLCMFLTEKCSFNQWADYSKWIFVIYAGANVGERATKLLKKESNG